VVEKIWLKKVLGAKLEFWEKFKGINVNTKSWKGFGVKQ
jgi:hypothetical protein